MSLPKQVQRQLAAAEAMNQPQEAGDGAVAPGVEVVEAPEPLAAPPQPVAPQEAPSPTPAQAEDWEHKYRTLRGIHNAHLGELKEQAARERARAEQAEAELRRLKEQSAQAQTQERVDPKYGDVFGSDLVEMVQDVARSMLAPVAAQVEARLAALEQNLAGAQAEVAKTAEDMFFDRVTELVPDWEAINTSEAFLAWLGESDPIYGVPRQNALTAAGKARDAERVATIFKSYKATLAPTAPGAPAASPAQRLEKQVNPRARGGAAQVNDGPKLITVEQVQAFYRDVQRGAYRGRDEVMRQRETEINTALAEGRIVERLPQQRL